MQYQFIQLQAELDAFVVNISDSKVLAIDTEFMRRRTLYPEIALIQVYDGEHLALIDPLSELDFSGLWHLLRDESIVKVLHSPSEDIEVFQKYAGFVPTPLFDTQFALQLLGEGNCVGFANMVKNMLDIELDKSMSRTDWLKRPLQASQLEYAAADVFYLLPCYQTISKKIAEKGLSHIVTCESQLIAQKRAFRTPDHYLYLGIKNVWQLKPRDLAVLRTLASWRQNKAEKKNLALNFVLKEHNMVEIAKRRPGSLNSLRNVPGVEPMEVNRSGKEILACIEAGKAIPESELPARVQRLIDYPGYKGAAKEIKQAIAEVAREHDIPVDVFASKKQINQVIGWNWKLDEQQRKTFLKPDLFQGWRHEILKDALSKWHIA
ncbi:ribonuclease D [Pseudoalteromonas rubra]|uniref:Ribonuclease D n=1 Tax=Pseudoalteromonas rubra TaxID=43658 RepID=A0A5S3WUB4_9GAMM|nr:ribonuclease D [Pseudoalteromonas rubra]TMP31695.1 ribonuclease D [Pseudoalteromonas rubra]TMP33223.1 ribonuclease D [Pseudoalteromonas rubra]